MGERIGRTASIGDNAWAHPVRARVPKRQGPARTAWMGRHRIDTSV